PLRGRSGELVGSMGGTALRALGLVRQRAGLADGDGGAGLADAAVDPLELFGRIGDQPAQGLTVQPHLCDALLFHDLSFLVESWRVCLPPGARGSAARGRVRLKSSMDSRRLLEPYTHEP